VSGRVEGESGLIHVECQGSLVVSCAMCGGMTQRWRYDPVELLPWTVIEHWLSAHWDGAYDEMFLDGEDRS
jgi:hypothetical protein